MLTVIGGVAFEKAWPARLEASLGGLTVNVLSRRDLIANKRAAGRLQDLADVEFLEEMDRGGGGGANPDRLSDDRAG